MERLNTHTMLAWSYFAYIYSQIDDSLLLTKILQEQKKVRILELNNNHNTPSSIFQETIMYHEAVWVPTEDLQLKVILSYHNDLVARHPGICKTKELICRDYNWKGLVPMVT